MANTVDTVIEKNPELKASIEYLKRTDKSNGSKYRIELSDDLSPHSRFSPMKNFDEVITKFSELFKNASDEKQIEGHLQRIVNWEIAKRWFNQLVTEIENKTTYFITQAALTPPEQAINYAYCGGVFWIKPEIQEESTLDVSIDMEKMMNSKRTLSENDETIVVISETKPSTDQDILKATVQRLSVINAEDLIKDINEVFDKLNK